MGGSRYRTRDRARETEDAVTGFLAENGWPQAARVGPFQPGADVTGTPGLRFEVKARRDLRLTEWLEQAGPRQPQDARLGSVMPAELPIVVHRPDGWGPAKVGLWPATTRLEDLVALLRNAGYGWRA
jgi:hypothetical protein